MVFAKNIATNSQPRFNKELAKQQLAALGYKSYKDICVRAFFPSDDPRHVEDEGRKAQGLDFNQIEAWQPEGRGIYFVVNGGGHKNTERFNVAYEWDVRLTKRHNSLLPICRSCYCSKGGAA